MWGHKMSFIDAAELASAGASQMMPFHSAPTQTTNNGVISLLGAITDRASHLEPAKTTHTTKGPSPSLRQGRSRYDLLRTLKSVAPKSALGLEAQSLLLGQSLLSRARLSKAALRPQEQAVDQLIQKAMKTPSLVKALDPKVRIRATMSSQSAPQKRQISNAQNDALFQDYLARAITRIAERHSHAPA